MKTNKVGRPEGLPKTGGRAKGTPNKATAKIQEKIISLLENNLDTLDNDLKSLEPKERIRMIIELLRFAIPTKKAIEADIDMDRNIETIEVLELKIAKSGKPPL